MIVEVCVTSVESAVIAEQAGADRIELCAELGIGGVTPSAGLFEQVKASVALPVHVLIRPRSGDFSYTNAEFEVMAADIRHFKALGADGIVCGALRKDYSPDIHRTEKLLEWSEGISFTFHRAFDWVKEPISAFIALQDMGVDCLLTSGKSNTAVEGLPLLNGLREMAGKTTVMPGAGIGPDNVQVFKEAGFKAIHLSATHLLKNLSQPPEITLMGTRILSETQIPRADLRRLRAVVQSVK